ncbi:branched-subunit amino acid transport protein|uniref:Branched-subunit amino acid transport protein n=1 Tax=Brenneria salicis ATCC 15712 = DSM 30166 TaxID=714314 RepID=A0A366I996_9GAMM|nr:AzlD domain-containing protein [Brenneria salicis]NMN91026.1 branched-subunit amino acid transport protein [Brenneria salicis ATCC 15712 = DSM 30166]RBP66522.1 branched-subunit amino acid transport protein [Brenneria salicis ATCC 15712 = DSM 30166]RLM32029.1 branched-chain amino acid transporter [Brenneria salicis ATCC 15712 = DSM 30166]
MNWLLLCTLAGIVFFNRYIFLEPRTPVKLPGLIQDMLKYSAQCLLSALCGPIIALTQGELRSFPDNPYFWGAVFCIIVAFLLRNMVACLLTSMAFFYLLSSLF